MSMSVWDNNSYKLQVSKNEMTADQKLIAIYQELAERHNYRITPCDGEVFLRKGKPNGRRMGIKLPDWSLRNGDVYVVLGIDYRPHETDVNVDQFRELGDVFYGLVRKCERILKPYASNGERMIVGEMGESLKFKNDTFVASQRICLKKDEEGTVKKLASDLSLGLD
jgi:hypothetical protein